MTKLDSTLGAYMKVPCWEPALSRQGQVNTCEDPLTPPPTFSTSTQRLYGGTWYSPALISGSSDISGDYFITAAPAALLGTCNNSAYDDLQYTNTLQQCERTFDLDGLVKTIRSCTSSVDLSVMDFLPRFAH